MTYRERVLVALDLPGAAAAIEMADKLRGKVGGFKIGKRLFVRSGPPVVGSVGSRDVFLDLKFHDIPNTVAEAADSAAYLGVKMFNVHCLGGAKMMRAAADAVNKCNPNWRPLVLGVTILTSHDRASLDTLGIRLGASIEEIVGDLAVMAQDSGLDGVVCSPREIAVVRKRCSDNFAIVTPGIRRASDKPDDQQRTMSLRQAIEEGATYAVAGRPIIAQPDPVAAAEELLAEAA